MTTEDSIKQEIMIEQKESLEITKNTKGYNWKIKIFPKSTIDEDWLKRLEYLNSEIKKRIGDIEE